MRALLFHCKNYAIKIKKLAKQPKGIKPENIKKKEQKNKDCIVTLITIEKRDNPRKLIELSKEILKMCEETGHKNVVILPFAHLSNKLEDSKKSIKLLDLIEEKLKNKVKIMRSHFGSHKSLLLDIYGHIGNARYREF